MRFEAREIKPYSVPVVASELKIGSVYFRVSFMDESMHIPVMETIVFIGKDLDLKDLDVDDKGKMYFQDYESYLQGIRFETLSKGDEAIFSCNAEDELDGVFEFERALDQLMWCSLRRRGIEDR
jgi:hypothetical protein